MPKAKSRASSRSKKKNKSGPGFVANLAGSFAWFAAPRRLAHMTLALVWVGIVVAAAVGAAPLRDRVSDLRAAPVVANIEYPPIAGSDDPAATWLPASERRRLEHLVTQTVSDDVFDRESLERLRAIFAASGWFSGPVEIRRFAENVVRVRGDWRTPFAAVRVNDRDHLVSPRGELLPLAYPAGGAGPTIPVITGARFGPPENQARGFAYGERWKGGDVPSAIALLVELRRAFSPTPQIMRQIAGVDCAAFGGREGLAIITDQGTRIVWGSAPGEERPGEARAQEKLARLVDLAGRPGGNGRIDAGARQITVSGPHVYIDVPGPANAAN